MGGLIKGTFQDMHDYLPNSIRPLRIDETTHTLQTIEYEHHEVHHGKSFTLHWSNTTSNDDDHRSMIVFYTPNTAGWLHLVANIGASASAEYFLVEGPTIDKSEGNQRYAIGRNRNSPNTSGILSLETVPVVGQYTCMVESEIDGANYSGGFEIEHFVMASGVGPNVAGGQARGQSEWILRPNTIYTFCIQNIGANINVHEFNLNWYEHTDKG
jgi:hypothetical protein